jgi:hypothetical protein
MYKEAIFALQQRLYYIKIRCRTLEEKVKLDKDLKPFLIHDVKEKNSIEAAIGVLEQREFLNSIVGDHDTR